MKIKKVAALALAAVMGASMLAGCASKSIDEDAVVVKMKDGEVRLGVANFMARYTQYTYDSIYGSYFKDDYCSTGYVGKRKDHGRGSKESGYGFLKDLLRISGAYR